MQDRIALSINEHGVAHVRLNRPAAMNALDGAMFDALLAAGEQLHGLRHVRAVVMSGEGASFCAGIDTANFDRIIRSAGGVDLGARSGGSDTPLQKRTHGRSNGPQQAVLCWRDLPVPVIAALHGPIFGGGLQLALGADLRFAAPGTRLAILEVAWGLVPDMAGMVLLRDLLADDVMRELTYTGRQLGCEEALRLGLVSRISNDPLADALAFAHDVAGRSPDAVRAAKRLLNAARHGSEAALLLAESREQDALIGSTNQLEAVRAQLERRPPRFENSA